MQRFSLFVEISRVMISALVQSLNQDGTAGRFPAGTATGTLHIAVKAWSQATTTLSLQKALLPCCATLKGLASAERGQQPSRGVPIDMHDRELRVCLDISRW